LGRVSRKNVRIALANWFCVWSWRLWVTNWCTEAHNGSTGFRCGQYAGPDRGRRAAEAIIQPVAWFGLLRGRRTGLTTFPAIDPERVAAPCTTGLVTCREWCPRPDTGPSQSARRSHRRRAARLHSHAARCRDPPFRWPRTQDMSAARSDDDRNFG
jgi:hypothetical protein